MPILACLGRRNRRHHRLGHWEQEDTRLDRRQQQHHHHWKRRQQQQPQPGWQKDRDWYLLWKTKWCSA